MRFPSIATLVEHAAAVFRRFPWTLLAGVVAAASGIVASTVGANDAWTRLTFVPALGLPLTLALSLLGDARAWGPGRRTGVLLAGVAGLAAALRVEAVAGARRGVLSLTQLNGTRSGDSALVTYWSGWVLAGRR